MQCFHFLSVLIRVTHGSRPRIGNLWTFHCALSLQTCNYPIELRSVVALMNSGTGFKRRLFRCLSMHWNAIGGVCSAAHSTFGSERWRWWQRWRVVLFMAFYQELRPLTSFWSSACSNKYYFTRQVDSSKEENKITKTGAQSKRDHESLSMMDSIKFTSKVAKRMVFQPAACHLWNRIWETISTIHMHDSSFGVSQGEWQCSVQSEKFWHSSGDISRRPNRLKPRTRSLKPKSLAWLPLKPFLKMMLSPSPKLGSE